MCTPAGSEHARITSKYVQIVVQREGSISCYSVPRNLTRDVEKEGTLVDFTNKLILDDEIAGSGGFGNVRKATWTISSFASSPSVAVKIFHKLPNGADPLSKRRVFIKLIYLPCSFTYYSASKSNVKSRCGNV